MAAPSSTNTQLPTVWLAPPPSLLPSNHHVSVEPIPIAISSVIALLVLVVVTLMFNKKRKFGDLDDITEKEHTANEELSNMVPGHSDFQQGVAEPLHVLRKPASRNASMYSNHTMRKGTKKHFSENWQATSDFDRHTSAQTPKDVTEIRLPPAARYRNGNLDDATTLADDSIVDFDDKSISDSEVPYRRFGHESSISQLDFPGYPASYNPSAFKPLAPEAVGMHGKIWK
ncbi:hypothetical protein N0V83_002633 [Neocucurbitaria cava]|uniref:Uncharacterized protein n=1 Tax=Neocucurbitaria cava TaxID=798079 RepID=A0A9W9CPT7_9PLEO|nr:hypothetical protein N0V83_002633 [Neocucurbitaria cava]